MVSKPPKSEHWSSEHLKKKGVRIPLLILLYCIVAFLLFLFVKAICGYPVKIFGIEVNQPIGSKQPDTVYKQSPIQVATDTVYVPASADYRKKTTQGAVNNHSLPKNDSTVEQKTTVTGDKNHTISGNYNNVGVNGDISVSQQPELNDWYKQFFIRHIDQIKRDSSISSNKIMIFVGMGSNAGKLSSELSSFLKGKGYDVSMALSLASFKGIGVDAGIDLDNTTKTVDIYLGNISQ